MVLFGTLIVASAVIRIAVQGFRTLFLIMIFGLILGGII